MLCTDTILGKDRAISSVLGSILLAGMVVLLIALMAGPMFITYFDDDQAPVAKFDISYDGENATVLYANGNPIDADRITVLHNGSEASAQFSQTTQTITPGNQVEFPADVDSKITVVWSNRGGSYGGILESSIISESDITADNEGDDGNPGETYFELVSVVHSAEVEDGDQVEFQITVVNNGDEAGSGEIILAEIESQHQSGSTFTDVDAEFINLHPDEDAEFTLEWQAQHTRNGNQDETYLVTIVTEDSSLETEIVVQS